MDNAFELGSILDEVNKKFEEAENAIETKLQKMFVLNLLNPGFIKIRFTFPEMKLNFFYLLSV